MTIFVSGSDFWDAASGKYVLMLKKADSPEYTVFPVYSQTATTDWRSGNLIAADDSEIMYLMNNQHTTTPGGQAIAVVTTDTKELVRFIQHPNPESRSALDIGITSFAMSASYYVVGFSNYFHTGSAYGQVLVFNRSDGSLLHTIDDPDQSTDELFVNPDRFGYAVSCNDTYLVATCPFQTEFPESLSDFYVFDISTGVQLARYNVDSNTTAAGRGISMYGNRIAIHGVREGSFKRLYIVDITNGNVDLTIDLVANYNHQDNPNIKLTDAYVVISAPSTESADTNIYVYSAVDGSLLNTIPRPTEITDQDSLYTERRYPVDMDVLGSKVVASCANFVYDSLGPGIGGRIFEFDITTGGLIRSYAPEDDLQAGAEFGTKVSYTPTGNIIASAIYYTDTVSDEGRLYDITSS